MDAGAARQRASGWCAIQRARTQRHRYTCVGIRHLIYTERWWCARQQSRARAHTHTHARARTDSQTRALVWRQLRPFWLACGSQHGALRHERQGPANLAQHTTHTRRRRRALAPCLSRALGPASGRDSRGWHGRTRCDGGGRWSSKDGGGAAANADSDRSRSEWASRAGHASTCIGKADRVDAAQGKRRGMRSAWISHTTSNHRLHTYTHVQMSLNRSASMESERDTHRR